MVGCVQMSRAARIAACFLAASALSGCGSDSDFGELGGMAWKSIGSIGGGGPGIERSQAAAIPYATRGARYGSNAEALLVLATKSGDETEWLAGTQVSIVTRAGRIVRTVGLPYNLTGFEGPIANTGAAAAPGSYHYLMDFSDRHLFGIFVNCTQADIGAERVEIIGGSHDTRHIVETCHAPQIDWDFQNDFWKDVGTGYVWESVQNIHPAADELTLEMLRPDQ
jgi:hypothetical protein